MVSKRIRQGRFPANLLVSDDVLNDGTVHRGDYARRGNLKGDNFGSYRNKIKESDPLPDIGVADSGSYSRYFDLDAWYEELFGSN